MKSKLKGQIAIFISALFFSLMAVGVSYGNRMFGLSGMLASLGRFLVGISIVLVLILIGVIKPEIKNLKGWLLRGIFGSVAMVLYFSSISYIGSARALLLNMTSPIFVAVFAYFIFKERVRKREIIAMLLSICGGFIIYQAGSTEIIGILTGIGSAVSAGFAINIVRELRNENAALVYAATCLSGLVLTFAEFPALLSASYIELAVLLLVGFLAFLGQIFMTWAYRNITASQGSAISYVSIPLTAILAHFFVGEPIDARFLFGGTLIFVGVLVAR
ncbi:MAG: DMT family transporter [Candidatus Micrarchaeia archaeon]